MPIMKFILREDLRERERERCVAREKHHQDDALFHLALVARCKSETAKNNLSWIISKSLHYTNLSNVYSTKDDLLSKGFLLG